MHKTIILTASSVLATIVLLGTGCDLASAQPKVTRWLSQEALMGLIVKQKGSEIEAEITLFDDPASMPDPEDVAESEGLGGLPLAYGVVDPDTKTLVFPLQNNTLVQANSAELLRKNGASYVEFDLDFSGPTLAGRWRDGANPPKYVRTFVRCDK
jgi:hypothetical protein